MIKQPHSSNAFTKFYYRPYGFKALITVDAGLLCAFSGGVGYAITGILNYPETTRNIVAAVLVLCVVTLLVLKKPKVYVALTSDGFQYRGRELFPKDYKIKYSDIYDIKKLVLTEGFLETACLEVITKDKKKHSLPSEFFNKKSDFEGLEKILITKTSPPPAPRNTPISSLDHTGTSIAEKCEYDEKFLLISNNCNQTLDNAEEEPANAEKYAQQLLEESKTILKEISDENKIAELKNMLANTVIDCVLLYSMETWKWQKSLLLCRKASIYATSLQTKKSLEEAINTIKCKEQLYKGFSNKFERPSLWNISVSGLPIFGYYFFGKYNKDSKSNTYVAAQYMMILLIPVFPLSRYRVSIDEKGEYTIHAKGSREPIDFVLPVAVIIVIIIIFHIF